MTKIILRRNVPDPGGVGIKVQPHVFADEVEISASVRMNLMSVSMCECAITLAYGDKVKNGDFVLVQGGDYTRLVEVTSADEG